MAIKTLYVGNLPYSTTDVELVAFFEPYGGKNARILEGRGFGFVDVDADHLEAAINDKHNAELGGRRLTVNEARPKVAGGGGGFGGGPRSNGGGERESYGGDRESYSGGGRDSYGGDRGGRGGRGGKGGRTPRW